MQQVPLCFMTATKMSTTPTEKTNTEKLLQQDGETMPWGS